MGYHLGVDLGTTFTAAAVERDGRVQVVTLGNRTVSIPSVVFVTADGAVLVGDAAERRGAAEPERLAREFKRRVGDPTPIILGGAPWSAEALMGKLLRWVVDRVTELEGGPPTAIALTHPANWGAYKLDLLQQAARHADVQVVRLLSEPEAAATAYASHERVAAGSIIAVYDLGGGTFDAAVLRKRDGGFDILGQPEGVERLGGVDIDQAVFVHVTGSLSGALDGLDHTDPAVMAAVGRLRRECVDAKEALSADTDVSIPVNLPGLTTGVRLTRSELEHMVRPALGESVIALRRALRSAGVTPEQVTSVLLVGGSSRIPLVGQLVGSEIGRPIAVDANPKDAVALGAAVAAAQAMGAVTPESVTPLPAAPVAPQPPVAPAPQPAPPQQWAPQPQYEQPQPAYQPQPTYQPQYEPQYQPAYQPQYEPQHDAAPTGGTGNRTTLWAALAAFVVLGVLAVVILLGGGDDPPEEDADDGATPTVSIADPTTTEDPGPTSPPTTLGFADPDVRAQFVEFCVPGQTNSSDPNGLCNCFFDEISAALSFNEYVDLNDALDRGEPLPQEIVDLIQPCGEQFP